MKTKIPGIRPYKGGQAIDKKMVVDGMTIRIFKSGYSLVSDALADMERVTAEALARAGIKNLPKTMEDLLNEYIVYKCTQLKQQTADGYYYALSKHFVSRFASLRVYEALSIENVRKWYLSFAQSMKTSPQRKNVIIKMFLDMVEKAWNWKYIASELYADINNIVQPVKVPTAPKVIKPIWTSDEKRMFMRAIPKDSQDYPMFALFLYLGCRISEFLAIKWSDFNEKEKSIKIAHQMVRLRGQKTIRSGELKTNGSYRTDMLTPELVALLEDYKKAMDAKEDQFMFSYHGDHSKAYSASSFRRRLYKYETEIGIPEESHIVPHGARHTKASEFMSVIKTLEQAKVAGDFLGHEVTTMVNVYGQARTFTQEDLMAKVRKA